MNTVDTPVTEQVAPAADAPVLKQELPPLQPPAPQAPALEKPAALNLTESEKAIAGKNRVYWKHLLTGDADTVPDEVRRIAGADDATLTPDERDYRVFSTINRSWYADHRNPDRNRVRTDWPQLRRGLAQELKVADDEREIYMALSLRYDEKKLRSAARTAYERVYQATLRGAAAPDLSDITQGLSEEYRSATHTVAARAAAEAQQQRERYLPMAQELAEGMEVIAALEEDAISLPQVAYSAPSLIRAVDALADMPAQDKQMVMYLAVQESRARRADELPEEESLGGRMLRGWRRGVAGLGMGVWQALGNTGIATLDNIGARLEGATGQALRQSAAMWDKRLQVVQEIRHATQQEVIPLSAPDSSRAETYLMDAAEALPSAVLTCAGGAGFITLTAAGMGDAVAEARLRSPETPQQLQLAAGVVGGAVQASIYMGVSRIGGRMLERTINNFMKSCGRGVGAFSWASLNAMSGITAESVKLMLAGKAAQLTDLSLQETAARVAGTASGIDWQQYGDNLTDVEVNMRESAALLPFLLIGAGRAALRHFRAPHRLVEDGTRLLDWGIDEHKVNQIVNERNMARKGDLLREALSGSTLWSAPGFIVEAVKALRLLNTDYFKGFESPEVVRDFLRLPAEASVVKRGDDAPRTHEEILNTPGHARDRSGYYVARNSERLKNVLALWDEWWTRSHINVHSSRVQLGEWQVRFGAESARYERSSRYLAELQHPDTAVPKRMQPAATYAPYAERERRALLQDRVAELQDLSYQFLMNVNPLESMMSKEYAVSRMRVEAERTRAEFLGNVGKTLVNAGLGMPREENLGKLCDWIQGYYLRKKYRERTRGARIDWIRDVPLDYLRKMSEHASFYKHIEYSEYPELQEAFRIFLGVRTNTELLMDLLPMTEDFQTALSRGMSPAQAYAHLAERELGYQADKLKNYPADSLAQSLNITPMEEYTRSNEEKCRVFMQLTGAALQQQQGDDGCTYWRLRRPDGSFSRWHESAAFAMNDVAANAALTFLPLGKGIHEHWAETARANNTDLSNLPLAKEGEFSGYDQLCRQALGDLVSHWMESAPYLQPGLQIERLRHRFAHNSSYGSGVVPMHVEVGTEHSPAYVFDAHTTATPLGMANARFYTAWQRLLSASVVQPQQAVDFLMSVGEPWAQEMAALPPPHLRESYHAAIADAMGRFSLQYFLMKLPHLPVPASVKEWVGMAAFCPPVEEGEMPSMVQMGKKHLGVMQWSNRRVAGVLRELLPQVDTLRSRYETTALPDAAVQSCLNGMLGIDPVQNAEQSWCCHYSGAAALHTLSPSLMALLRSPAEWWPRMSPIERDMLHQYVEPFCTQNLLPGTTVGEDAVAASIANLDAVLQRFPQLHYMSPAGANRGRVLTLQLPPMPDEAVPPLTEPLYTPPAFPYAKDVHEVGVYTDVDASLYPELAEPAVQHAMQFLDVLRRYPAVLPYATQNGIRWNHLNYGGKNGARPNGLELHKPVRPLLHVTRLLKEVHELCAAKGSDFLNFCGVPIPDVKPHELACPALQNITVYRQPMHELRGREITHLCRLMPGDASAPDLRERTPYMTEVRRGAYMAADSAVKDASDPQACMIPLQSFTHAPHRAISDAHRMEWGQSILKHSLDALCDLTAADASFMEHRVCNGISLTEVLMRLFEDTNYSAGVLGRQSIHELTPPVLRSLRLAADIISCLAAPYSASSPQAVQAFKRLQNTVTRIKNNTMQRETLEHILTRGSQYLLDKVSEMPLPRKTDK